MLWVNRPTISLTRWIPGKIVSRIAEQGRVNCVYIRMPHGHGPAGENPTEIHVFCRSILRIRVNHWSKSRGRDRPTASWATFKNRETPRIVRAELNFTQDLGKWPDRKWEQAPAKVDLEARRVTAAIPAGAEVYLNLFDDRECPCSSTFWPVIKSPSAIVEHTPHSNAFQRDAAVTYA